VFLSTFIFPLTVERAKELKPNTRMVLVGTVQNARTYVDEQFDAATINNPLEVTIKKYYVDSVLREIRLVDCRTGETLKNFRVN